MGKRFYIVKKVGHESENNETNEFWENKDYQAYKEKHGMHFSDRMAMWTSAHMTNADGKDHGWSVDDVKAAFASFGYTLKNGYTWGDVTYMANMLYADYAKCLKADTDAVKMAYAITEDPDGYDGMIFNRYTADIMSKNEHVPWAKLM